MERDILKNDTARRRRFAAPAELSRRSPSAAFISDRASGSKTTLTPFGRHSEGGSKNVPTDSAFRLCSLDILLESAGLPVVVWTACSGGRRALPGTRIQS
jgi:hypothetical protein